MGLERKAVGNVFRTKAEAKAEVERRKLMVELRDFAKRENGGWVPEWRDMSNKYCIGMDGEAEALIVECFMMTYWMGQVWFKTRDGAERALAHFGDRLKGLF